MISLATATFMCAAPPPELRALWSRAAESVRALRDWLRENKHRPAVAAVADELLIAYGQEEYRLWERTPTAS